MGWMKEQLAGFVNPSPRASASTSTPNINYWSIGKIRGRFQPEDFTENQKLKTKDFVTWGSVSRVMFSGWDPREVTLSFVVDSVHTSETDSDYNSQSVSPKEGGTPCPLYDPEKVWDYIQQLQRPYPRPAYIMPIPVYIPGWGSRGEEVKSAYITSASIKRTHITVKDPKQASIKAVRATITLTLKEAVFFGKKAEADENKQIFFAAESRR